MSLWFVGGINTFYRTIFDLIGLVKLMSSSEFLRPIATLLTVSDLTAYFL